MKYSVFTKDFRKKEHISPSYLPFIIKFGMITLGVFLIAFGYIVSVGG